ncbi:CHAT domain protein [Ceratobasidium sp. AG-Ba]|nr:CHAT domain protein [Ceratobasidium sp. AG-Ba]
MLPKSNPHAHIDGTIILSGGLDVAPATNQEPAHQSEIANKIARHEVDLVGEHGKMLHTSDDLKAQTVRPRAVEGQSQDGHREQSNNRPSDIFATDKRQPIELGDMVQSFTAVWIESKNISDIDEAIENPSHVLKLSLEGNTLREVHLRALVAALNCRFDLFGAQEDLAVEMNCRIEAMYVAHDKHPDKSDRLSRLGGSWYRRFERLGKLADLNHAIHCHSQAVLLAPDGHPDKPRYLNNIGCSWYRRFQRLGDLADLDHAMQCHFQAAALTPNGHPDMPSHLNNLGSSWYCRFERLGELADLDYAMHCYSQTVVLTPDGHPNRPSYLSNLGSSWYGRFVRLGELADLGRAMDCQSRAVVLAPDGHPDKPSCLSGLGDSWASRFERLGELADLNQAVHCHSQAVILTPDGHPNKPSYLSKLGCSWCDRFERLGELTDLDHAMQCQSQAVELTPDGHPDRPIYLNRMGCSWYRRFERLGDLADLDHAMQCHSQAAALTPNGHPNMPSHLNNLGSSWYCRFERLGELADLDYAMHCYSQAVVLTPDGHPEKPVCLDGLGGSWFSRYERLGALTDLDYAIHCQSQAVALTLDGHSNKLSFLNNLGKSWFRRFERLGELVDLDHAIHFFSQAVVLTPDGHPHKPACLSGLGVSWSSRYERLGEVADLDHAIDCQSQAVDLTPDNHPDKPSGLCNLGTSWYRRFKRLGELDDIDRAIHCQSRAVLFIPDDRPDKRICLNNLGISWYRRFEQLGELADLDHAIHCHSQAVLLTPDGHPDKPRSLNNLGNPWARRFERLGKLADLNRAIYCQSQAVVLTPDGHTEKPTRLNNLGCSWYCRYERLTGELADLEKACRAFRYGATTATFNPRTQMNCAQMWAAACAPLELPPQEAYQVAFSLLPRLVWIGQTTQCRHDNMVVVRDLAAQAAAWAISVKLYDLALEWLEQGRSVVWGQTLQLRTPFDDLHLAYPELALRLQFISSQLDATVSRSVERPQNSRFLTDLTSESAKQHQLASERDYLLGEVRKLPGFTNFLEPLNSNDLKQAAQHGPIIVINTYHAQCDALIVLPGREDIIHVPLNKVQPDSLSQLVAEVHTSMRQRGSPEDARGFTRQKPQDTPLPVLMWSGIVEPVLEALGYMENTNRDELPHVTWCTTGAMSLLPLHAAGMYDGKTPNASNLVVSSYTPTLTALLWHKNPSSTQVGLLAVGQQASLGQAPLPCTVEELRAISKYNTVTTYHELDGTSATVDSTLAAMQENSWVHLACHAVQDLSNPSQSAFHLHDGPLTLEEIGRRQFKNKGLAFLSACQTATGDHALPDEATHLAAGMLIAGYPSVIGTMWSIMDEDAPLVADIVYYELLKDGMMDHTKSARALHKAVKVLREKVGEKEIWRWAPFIHIGV